MDINYIRSKEEIKKRTYKVLLQNKLAIGFMWAASGITIGILIIILGFIIVNGVYTGSKEELPFLSFSEQKFKALDSDSREMMLITNNRLRLKEITYDDLKEIFSLSTRFWGYITGQNISINTYIYSGDKFDENINDFMLINNQVLHKEIKCIADKNKLLNEIRNNIGAIGVVPATWEEDLKKVKIIGLRQVCIVVNPVITQIQDGKKLKYLSSEPNSQLHDLLTGKVKYWNEVEGPYDERKVDGKIEYAPLEVFPVIFKPDRNKRSYIYDYLSGNRSFSNNTIFVDLLSSFGSSIANIKGAVGIINRRESLSMGLKTLKIQRVLHSVNLKSNFFMEAPSRAGAVGGISYIIINTLVMVAFVLLIASPVGVAAAIFIVEYAKQGKLLSVLRLCTNTLAGVPSIIFGLFGLVFFSQFLGLKTGLLSGSLTITIMILPTIIRTSEEALRSIPKELREGSLALGATRHQTIFKIIVPSASPGILTGLILGLGRAAGETAAVLYTMGSNLALIRSFNSPVRVLSIHLYMLIRENISLPNAFATATILVVIILIVNLTTKLLIGRMNRIVGIKS